MIGRAALAAASGVSTWLAFPPVDLWPAAVVGVTGFVLAVHGVRARRGAWLGLVYGGSLFVPLLWWVGALGVDALVLLALLEATGTALVGAAVAGVSRLRGWAVWSALLWVGGELVRANVPFGGFPWGRLAFGQAGSPYASYAAVGGAPLVTAAVALSGSLLAATVLGRAQHSRVRRTGALGAVAAAVAIPLVALLVPIGAAAGGTTGDATVTVALVQGNVPEVGTEHLGRARTVTRNHRDATLELAADVAAGERPAPDVVIWPENSTDIDPFTDPETAAVIEEAVDTVDVPLLVGAILDGPGDDFRRTAGVVWEPGSGADTDNIYVKRHPVPFGEYIPFRELLLPLVGRLEQVGRETFAGDEPGVLELGPLTVGDVICFEIAYDSIVRDVVAGGAEVIVVQTNNATFGLTAQPEQQFAISRLRAVEHGRAVLVAATSGVSGVIGPDGSVRARTAEFTREVIVADVVPQDGRTMATRLGPWPEWLMAGAGVGALVVAAGQSRRRRGEQAEVAASEVGPSQVAGSEVGRRHTSER